MRNFGKLGVVGVILIWMMTPGMACLLPGGQLAEEQDVCCRRMHGECEQMPFSDSCCESTGHPSDEGLAVQSPSYAPEMAAALLPAEAAPEVAAAARFLTLRSNAHSPPDPLSGFHAILRI